MNENRLLWTDAEKEFPPVVPDDAIKDEWVAAAGLIKGKIIVLDDDPTGIQTVHSLPVYTSWDYESLKSIMREKHKTVYILTNSRALTTSQTEALHRQLINDLMLAADEAGEDFHVISRSDSTLRGHYPLETQVIYEELSKKFSIDGEIITPFFKEGGRLTFNDIHYVKEGDEVVPAGQTEFALDSTFGYGSSNLKEWIDEKTKGQYTSDSVVSISLDVLRRKDIDAIEAMLDSVSNFGKVIVNAVEYSDLRVFCIGLSRALNRGKKFVFRTAASFVQVVGGIIPKPLLGQKDLYPSGKPSSPGLIIAGSYVKKTTRQLEKLREVPGLMFIEFDVNRAVTEEGIDEEVDRVITCADNAIVQGMNACIYTSRKYHRSDEQHAQSEKNLVFSTRVSDGLVKVVHGLKTKPGFIVAKGGITSSDLGVKGLNVKRAMVAGQIQPGVPVWILGDGDRFPGIPYVIFPGNVGSDDSLKKAVEILVK